MIDATRNPCGTAYTVLHDAKYSIAGKHLRPRFWHSLLALIIVMLPVLLIAEQPDLGIPYWWAARGIRHLSGGGELALDRSNGVGRCYGILCAIISASEF